MDRLEAISGNHSIGSEYERACKLISTAGREVIGYFQPETGNTKWLGDLGSTFLGYPPGDVLPPLNLLHELIDEEDREAFSEQWDALLRGEIEEEEIHMRHTCDSIVRLRLRQTPDPDHPGWHFVRFQNIPKECEKRAHQNESARIEAVQSLAGGLAHEFNNLLTPVTGFIELAMEELGQNHPAALDLQVALKQVNGCCDLIGHMQSYSGSGVVSPRATQLSSTSGTLVQRAINLESESADITLEESNELNIPPVMVDHGSYRKIITHIVRNALAAMPEDGILRLRTESVPDAPIPNPNPLGYVRVSISDNGCGMSPDVLRRIRDPFFTTHGRALAKGLGIPMIHGMMRQHNGCLEITSAEGQGSTISLYFPVEESIVPHIDPDGTMAVEAAAQAGRVLIADDEDVIRRLMVRVFQGDGWIVQESHDFNELLEIVEKNPEWFDLILMDFSMPGPSPEEAVSRMTAAGCTANLMVVTGMAQDERLENLLEACNGEYVSKPFSPKSLLTSVDKFLTESKA